MKTMVGPLFRAMRVVFWSRAELLLEVAALGQQLTVYQRETPRSKLQGGDRLFWIWLCRRSAGWRSALAMVKPEPVVRVGPVSEESGGGYFRVPWISPRSASMVVRSDGTARTRDSR